MAVTNANRLARRLADGITSVATAAARLAAFATPSAGQRIYREDSGAIERYAGGVWSPLRTLGGREVFNVKHYGADGSGGDVSAAITDIIAAMPGAGGDIYFPPGDYALSTQLLVDRAIRLIGAGRGLSTILWGSNSAAILNSGTTPRLWFEMRGLKVEASAISAALTPIVDLRYLLNALVADCYFYDSGLAGTSVGVRVLEMGARILNNYFGSVRYDITLLSGAVGAVVEGNYCEIREVGGTAGVGVYVDGAKGTIIRGNFFDDGAGFYDSRGVRVLTASSGTVVDGNHFKGCMAGIAIDAGALNTLVGVNSYDDCVDNLVDAATIATGTVRVDGNRETLHGWSQVTTVAANQASVALTDVLTPRGRTMMRSGAVVGIRLNLSTARSGGSLTATVQKSTDDGATWGDLCALVHDTATTKYAVTADTGFAPATTFPRGQFTFAARDRLRVTVTTNGTWAPTANNLDVAVETLS